MGDAPNILVVEDDRAIRETMAEVLTGEGFQVTCVANGAEALEALERGQAPSLILLDLMMPVMDGWAFRLVQRQDPRLSGIPVVVLSAGAGMEARLLHLEPAAFIPKPFELDHLLHTVGRFVTP